MVLRIIKFFIYDAAINILFDSIFKNFSIKNTVDNISINVNSVKILFNTSSWDLMYCILTDSTVIYYVKTGGLTHWSSCEVNNTDLECAKRMQAIVKLIYKIDSIII